MSVPSLRYPPGQHRQQQHWQRWNQFGMTVFLSAPRYDWSAPLSHPSSCMLMNHGPSQQSSNEEYVPWKWGATARYYASHAKTMLPMRKSMPRSSSQSDHTKTSWPSWRDANCSGMVTSRQSEVWPKPSVVLTPGFHTIWYQHIKTIMRAKNVCKARQRTPSCLLQSKVRAEYKLRRFVQTGSFGLSVYTTMY